MKTFAAKLGFTLLEVMVATGLLAFLTAAAMGAFVAQTRATNTQQQTSIANDRAREGVRFISNDVRSAGAGMNPATGGFPGCAPGTVPFDPGGGAVACLPPVFRSTSPLFYANATTTNSTPYPACPSSPAGSGLYHPAYQLDFGGGVVEPTNTRFFCPDDLVVLAVDDTEPLFMVQSTPAGPSIGNLAPILFAGTQWPVAPANYRGYGFDDSLPNLAPGSLLLFGGASNAVLMAATIGVGGANGTPYAPASPVCTLPSCATSYYNLIPTTTSIDLFRSNLNFGTVAMPGRLVQYAIEPVNAQGGNVAPFVSANLVRSVVVPNGALPISNNYPFQVVSTSVLVQGVIDMQVEFGIFVSDPLNPGTGQLRYVSSGGFQSTAWTAPLINPAPAADTIQQLNSCLGAGLGGGVFPGVCFPNNGVNGLNALVQLRTVRINLTVRSSTIDNSRSSSGSKSTAGQSVPFNIQPAGQDLANGNVEMQSWVANPAPPVNGTPPLYSQTVDGADYRQISTEIYVRNMGWTNSI